MSYQPIFNNATAMTINNRRTVAQTQTRSGVVRSVAQNNSVWRFTVSMPSGVPWEDYRTIIAEYEPLNRYTTDTIDLSQTGFAWMYPYQGDEPNIANVRVSVINDELRVQSGVTITSGNLFLAGDLIQLVGGRVYQVTDTVLWSDSVIPTHRAPVDEAVGTYDTNIGVNAQWTVICTNMPIWSFVDHKRIGWSGDFEFQEVMS
jgi:hypothetical protein